jgi:formiminotetrahydrofolate cyclodeaminase
LLTDRSIRDALAAFASAEPTPGGGSAAALAGALGAALLMMVASLPKTRSNSGDDRTALAAAQAALTGIQQQLTEAVDADRAAYDAVVAAYREPSKTDAEKAVRKAAIQRALKGATDVPLSVMRLSMEAVRHAHAVAAHGHRAASSDVGVALALLQAALEGARLNVLVNVESLTDTAYVGAVNAESERLAARVPGLVADAIAAMGGY